MEVKGDLTRAKLGHKIQLISIYGKARALGFEVFPKFSQHFPNSNSFHLHNRICTLQIVGVLGICAKRGRNFGVR